MTEKCLLAASMAILICHPRTSINCFSHKQTLNPHKHKYIYPNSKDIENQNQPNSNKKPENSHEQVASTRSKLDIPSPLTLLRAQREVSASSLCSASSLARGGRLFHSVKNIFVMGWDQNSSPEIEQILVVNHGADAVNKFEEYRQTVKLRAAAKEKKQTKKLTVDGNEFLAFHGAVVTCSIGINGVSRTCHDKKLRCGLCRMMNMVMEAEEKSKKKKMKKSIRFNENSWRAHQKVAVMESRVCGRKAIAMCRVIAGRIGEDSVMSDAHKGEELMVFNPSAVLPSFVVIYNIVTSF